MRALCFWINFRLLYALNNFNEELLCFGEKYFVYDDDGRSEHEHEWKCTCNLASAHKH